MIFNWSIMSLSMPTYTIRNYYKTINLYNIQINSTNDRQKR